MIEGWERNTRVLSSARTMTVLTILLPPSFIIFAVLGYRSIFLPRSMATFYLGMAIFSAVYGVFFIPWFRRNCEENAKKLVRTFPVNDLEARERLEALLTREGVRFERERWKLRVAYGGTMVDVELMPGGELTHVSVEPPEEEWTMEDLLRQIDEALAPPHHREGDA